MEEKTLSTSVVRKLHTLHDISVLLNSTLDLREVLERALSSAEDVLEAEVSSVFVHDQVTEELIFYIPTGEKRAALEGVRLPKGQGIVGWVVENRQAANVPEVRKDPRFLSWVDERTGFHTRSLLCIPLVSKGKVVGALEVINRRDGGPFADEDLSLLETLGNHVATALDNALLYQELTRAHEALRKLDEIKSSFIAISSHELKVIQSYHELLKQGGLGPFSDTQQEALGKMEASLTWLNRLVADLGTNPLQALQAIAVLLNSTLDLREVLEQALKSAEEFFKAEASSVFLRDPVTEELIFYAMTGEKRAVLQDFRLPKGQGVASWVVEHRQTVHVPDARQDPRFFSQVDQRSGFQTRSILCVPLVTKQKVLGALEVINRRGGEDFAETDLSFLETLGNYVATALDNALLYRELSQAHEALKKLDEMKSNFIAVASHELRTPVTVVRASHELLQTEVFGPLNPKQKEALARMAANITWLSRTVSTLTSIVSLDLRQVRLNVRVFDMAALIREVAVGIEPFFFQRHQRFSTAGTEKEGLARGDPEQISQVLRILLLNAIRFTPDEGEIKVTLEASEFGARVAVSDTGIGIPQGEFGRIFEQFYEVQSAATHSSGTVEFKSAGLGLGLATAKRIVELHCGRIWVESEVNKGSTFYFTLPRQL